MEVVAKIEGRASAPDTETGRGTLSARARALSTLRRADATRVGGKAANLGELAAAGFLVPDGYAIPAMLLSGAPALGSEARDAIADAARALGPAPLAVRSSALGEDGEAASFAGIYESVLDVSGPDAAIEAAQRCVAALGDPRVRAYRAARSPDDAPRMALLVQRLVRAEVAGVAFSANPITGARDEVLVSAVRGLGDTLVSGAARGEEWLVVGATATRRRSAEGDASVLEAAGACEIADLVRRIASHFGAPQDVEWALADGRLHVLQARPITALPEPADWTPPVAGAWMRNFRLGEWLTGPITPLFETWLVDRCEATFHEEQVRVCGLRVRGPLHVVVNGWYFHSPFGTSGMGAVVLAMLRRPSYWFAFSKVESDPMLVDRTIAGPHTAAWRTTIMPRYETAIAALETASAGGEPDAITSAIDAVGDALGAYLWNFAMVGGFAWKVEAVLAAFHHAHVAPRVGGTHHALVAGLVVPAACAAHAVTSIDWVHPIPDAAPSPRSGAHDRLRTERETQHSAARAALAHEPALLARFETLLEMAQRYASLREEQASALTLAWPALRRAVLRLGDVLVARGALARAEEVFFVERAELATALAAASGATRLAVRADDRRRTHERRARLTPPLALGALPGPMAAAFARAVEGMRAAPSATGANVVSGMAASPGRVRGRARIVRGPEDFHRLRDGEVLVAPTTAPAWTPLFARASAVVTDGGSVVAHASLVAREYGIPSVVGTGNATERLVDGMEVVVDGSAGHVEIVGAS